MGRAGRDGMICTMVEAAKDMLYRLAWQRLLSFVQLSNSAVGGGGGEGGCITKGVTNHTSALNQ